MASPTQTSTWDRETPCPCKGCTVAREQERQSIIENLTAYMNKYNVGVQAINWSYQNVINLLEEKRI